MLRRLVSRGGTVSAAKMIHARVKKQDVAHIEVGWNGCRCQRHLRVYWGGITVLDLDGGTFTPLLNTTSSFNQWLVIGIPDTGAVVIVGVAGVVSRGIRRGAKHQVGAGGHGGIKLVRVMST